MDTLRLLLALFVFVFEGFGLVELRRKLRSHSMLPYQRGRGLRSRFRL